MSALLQMRVVALGKSAFYLFIQFGQHGGILDGGEMPRLEVHAAGGIRCRFQYKVQISGRNLLFRISTHAAARLDVFQYFVAHCQDICFLCKESKCVKFQSAVPPIRR